jgi:hypothetical protein
MFCFSTVSPSLKIRSVRARVTYDWRFPANQFILAPIFLRKNIKEFSSYLTGNTLQVSATKPNRLMLFGETVAVYCENHTEHTDTLCGQNAEYYNVKAGATYSNHWTL